MLLLTYKLLMKISGVHMCIAGIQMSCKFSYSLEFHFRYSSIHLCTTTARVNATANIHTTRVIEYVTITLLQGVPCKRVRPLHIRNFQLITHRMSLRINYSGPTNGVLSDCLIFLTFCDYDKQWRHSGWCLSLIHI